MTNLEKKSEEQVKSLEVTLNSAISSLESDYSEQLKSAHESMRKSTTSLKKDLEDQTRSLKRSLILSKFWNMSMIVIISLALAVILVMVCVIYWEKTKITDLWKDINQAQKTLESLPKEVKFLIDPDGNYLIFERKQESYMSTSGNWVIKLEN